MDQIGVIDDQPKLTKRRGRPPKKVDVVEVPQESSLTPTVSPKQEMIKEFLRMARRVDSTVRVVDDTIQQYTTETLDSYMANPVQYRAQLVQVNNYMYNASSYFREYVNYHVKSALYRWTINTEVKTDAFYTIDQTKMKTDFTAFVDRVNRLNLGVELDMILMKLFLEDAVYGYWLEDGTTSTLYYLPSNWCILRNKVNGRWSYLIDSRQVSDTNLQRLPRELMSLISRYKGKAGDDALVIVPFNKMLCLKANSHFNYIFPPFTAILREILRLDRLIQIVDAKTELDALNIIEMLIPTDETQEDHLMLTSDVVEAFTIMAKNIVPSIVGVVPTPMKMESIPLSRNDAQNRNDIQNALETYETASGMPNFGGSNTGAEMNRAIQNMSAKVFAIYNQLSQAINLKLQLDVPEDPAYRFLFQILNLNIYNEADEQKRMLTLAQAGMINKMQFAASYNINPSAYVGQSFLENTVLRDVIDNMTVPPSSHTQAGTTSAGGRPTSDDTEVAPSTEVTRDTGANDPANRA